MIKQTVSWLVGYGFASQQKLQTLKDDDDDDDDDDNHVSNNNNNNGNNNKRKKKKKKKKKKKNTNNNNNKTKNYLNVLHIKLSSICFVEYTTIYKGLITILVPASAPRLV